MKILQKLSIIEWVLAIAIVCLPLYSYAVELVRQKNVATVISFPIINSTGAEIINATGLLAQISTFNDSSTPTNFTNSTNNVTQIQESGRYYLNLTQAEMNYDYILLKIYSNSTGALEQNLLIRTIAGKPQYAATTDDGGAINVTNGKIDEVSTLTGHTPQTGDAYEKVNNATFGLSVIKDFVDDLETRLTALRAGYLDKLNVSGTLAHSDAANTYKADVSGLATSAALEVVNATTTSINGTVVAIKAQTDKLQFDASNYTKSTPQTGVTVTTNNDKTGYALTQTFPANFSALSINATGLVDILQTAADKVWGTAARSLTDKAGFSISGTKTTLDALNDINATNVWDKDISGYSTAGYAGTYLKGLWDKKPAGNMLSDTVWNATKAAYLDAAVSSRSTLGASDVWGYANRTLTQSVNATIGAGDIANITAGVWNASLPGTYTSGKAGYILGNLAAEADPWAITLPGTYTPGQAGYIIGNNLNASVGSRMAAFDLPNNFSNMTIDGDGKVTTKNPGTTVY